MARDNDLFNRAFLMFNMTKECLICGGHSYANLGFLILGTGSFFRSLFHKKDVFPCFPI